MYRALFVAAGAFALLTSCSPDSGVITTGQSGSGDFDTSTTFIGDGSTTTVVDEESTTVGPSTTLDAATTAPATTEPTPTDPPSTDGTTVDTEPEAPVGIPVTGAGTEWRAGPEEGDPEAFGESTDCAAFFAALGAGPYLVSECGEWDAIGGTRVWTITQGATMRWVAVIWQQHAPGAWIPLLRLIEDEAGIWSGVSIVTGNIDTGPNDELVSGIRNSGTGQFLTVEVIDIRSSAPRVVARVPDLHKGSAVLAPEGVYLYQAVGEGPECCPTAFDQYLLASTDDGWFIVEGAAGISPDAVPPSEL